VLGNILNEVSGCFHAGELRALWQVLHFDPAWTCGCGSVLTSCPVWSAVLEEVVPPGRDVREFAGTIWQTQRDAVRNRDLPALMGPAVAGHGDIEGYRTVLERTYRAISRVSGADVIVDSSKAPSEAAALSGLPLRSFLLRLVRDPRAIAFAWSRTNQYLVEQSLMRATARWNLHSWGADFVAHRFPGETTRVRYEDLVADPEGTVDEILCQAGLAERGNPVHGNRAELHGNHTVAGNPDRGRTGPVTLAPDRRWETGLGRRRALLVVGLTAPLMLRYGYL